MGTSIIERPYPPPKSPVFPETAARPLHGDGALVERAGSLPEALTYSIASVLVWIDLEMTGLDPARHAVVEIATLVTDDDLNVLAEGPDLVVHADEQQLALMDPVVREMHSRSGLLGEIEASTLSLEEASRLTMDFLRVHVPEARTVPLCGNSIGTDRRFLAAQLPEVEGWLHYRSVDVSTVKELCRRWYPQAFAAAPAKKTSHRALDDIRESVAELAYYRGAIFAPTEGSHDQEPTQARPQPPARARSQSGEPAQVAEP